MYVAIPHHRLVVRTRPALRAAIEVQRGRVHRVAFDCVEDFGMPRQRTEEAVRPWEIWMRRDHQSGAPLLEPPHMVERSHAFDLVLLKVDQEHMAAFDRAFDPWNQEQAALGGVGFKRTDI